MYQGITPSVPEAFIKKLKRIDPGLSCTFHRGHSKFVITQRGRVSGNVPVAIVEGNDGGGYRYPDNRDIIMLHNADMHRSGQESKDRVRKGEEYMIGATERSHEKAAQEIMEVTRDDKNQLMRTFAEAGNMGKFNSTFRRIEVKPRKGYIVKDKRLIKINPDD